LSPGKNFVSNKFEKSRKNKICIEMIMVVFSYREKGGKVQILLPVKLPKAKIYKKFFWR